MLCLCGALLLCLSAVSLSVGSYPITLRDVFSVFREETVGGRVFWQLRLPRTAMAILAGVVLSLCGGVYQLIFQNPLASPDLTGVASGASLGAACAIVLGSGSAVAIMSGAFLFGILALIAVLALVRFSRGGSYILAGVIVSSLCEAALMLLKRIADPEGELAALEFWTMGSLATITADKLFPVLLTTILPITLLFIFHRQAEMLAFSDEETRSMGLSPRLWRALLAALTTLAVAAVISVTGVISFLGLIAPHIAYRLLGRRSGGFLPLSALSGAILLLAADIPARSLSDGAELPLSVFTVLFAAPLLAAMLARGEDTPP